MRVVLTIAAVSLLLCGCSGNGSSNAASTDSSASTSDKQAANIDAADGDNYDACHDGDCEVEVRKKATISTDAKQLGTPKLDVTVADGEVKILVAHSDDDGHGTVRISGSGSSTINGLSFYAPVINDDVAVLDIEWMG